MLHTLSSRSIRNLHLLEFLAPRAFGYRPASLLASARGTERLSAPSPRHASPPQSSPGIPDSDILFFNQRLVQLRQALSARDTQGVWRHWVQLRQKNLLTLFGPQLGQYSRLLATVCPQKSQDWHPDDRKAIEEIAFYAATQGAPSALVAYMATHLRGGDRQTVLDLYARFIQAINEKPLSRDDIPQEEDSDLEELVIDLPGDPHPPSVVPPSLLLTVIIAHALGDSFHAALHTYLQSPAPIPSRIVHDVLRPFNNKPLTKRVEEYVERLHVARCVSEPRFLTARASVFAANRDATRLKKLYQSLIDGIGGSEPYIAANEAGITPDTPIALNEIHWGTLLTAFLQCNCRDLAAGLWDDMMRFHVQPTIITWNALLVGYERIGAAEDAENAWNTMISIGLEPTTPAFRAIISAFFNARKPDDAMKYLDLFRERLASGLSPTSEDTLTLYNNVLHGLLKSRRETEAHALLQKLRVDGPKPDTVSYNSLLYHHGRRGEFRAVSRTLDWMREDGLVGDVYTFSTVLSALLKVGRTDATDAILSLMRKQNVEPNVAFFTAIINHQMEEGTVQGLQAAMELLKKMEQSPDTQPNEVTYTGVLTSLHRHEWPDLTLAQQCKNHVLERMKRRNIQLNRAGYHVLINACLENPSQKGTEDAIGYYKKMVGARISIGPDTWYILLRGVIHKEDWTVGDALVEEMIRGRDVYGKLENLIWRIRKRKGWRRTIAPRAYF